MKPLRFEPCLFLFFTILAGCTQSNSHKHDNRPRICPMIYAPVCGERRGEKRDFANRCEANKSGFHIVGQGTCSAAALPAAACTREYRPVCGVKGHVRETMANKCMAENAGFHIIAQGHCR